MDCELLSMSCCLWALSVLVLSEVLLCCEVGFVQWDDGEVETGSTFSLRAGSLCEGSGLVVSYGRIVAMRCLELLFLPVGPFLPIGWNPLFSWCPLCAFDLLELSPMELSYSVHPFKIVDYGVE